MYCIQYENLSSPTQDLVRKAFADRTFKNEYIVYQYTDQDPYDIYGYVSVKQMNMTESRYFCELRSATLGNNGYDITEEILNTKCCCITDMVFKNLLSEEDMKSVLLVIATLCADEDKKVILWKDHNNHLLFYPIEPKTNANFFYPSLVEYFIKNL